MKSGLAIFFAACGLFNPAAIAQQVATHPPSGHYAIGWIGNTFGDFQRHVQQQITDIAVLPEGTVLSNSVWDEGGHEATVYRGGQPVGSFEDLHGWGRSGGGAIAADADFAYIAMAQNGLDGADSRMNRNGLPDYPPRDVYWQVVRRYSLATRKPVPFRGGQGWDGSLLVVSSRGSVTGVAVDDQHLYASVNAENVIRVYDKTTFAPLMEWPVAHVGKLALDHEGKLWAIEKPSLGISAQLVCIGRDGTPCAAAILLPPEVIPDGIGFDTKDRLMIADNGPDQNIKFYVPSRGAMPVAEFGVRGGIHAPPDRGGIGAQRFNGPVGAQMDAQDTLYVAQASPEQGVGAGLDSYSPDGHLLWRLAGTEFVNSADFDPDSDGTEVYSDNERFTLELSRPGVIAMYAGYTISQLPHADYQSSADFRFHIGGVTPILRRVGGQLLMFLLPQTAPGVVGLMRMGSPGSDETAVTVSIFGNQHYAGAWPPGQPAKGSWIWRDANGDGIIEGSEYSALWQYSPDAWPFGIDDEAGLWTVQEAPSPGVIRRMAVTGLDRYRTPIYDPAKIVTEALPDGISLIQRLEYDTAADALYIGGYTSKKPLPRGDWGDVGSVVRRYDGWRTGALHLRYEIALPYGLEVDGKTRHLPKSMSIAGDYLFVAEVKTGGVINIYRKSDGAYVGTLSTPKEIQGGAWVDSLTCCEPSRRKNGEYLIANECVSSAKVLIYRWYP